MKAEGQLTNYLALLRMCTQLASLFLALITVSWATETFASNPVTNAPVLKIDYLHWMSKDRAGSKSHPYRIAVCDSVILDTADYTFVSPEGLKAMPPNLIRVHYGDVMDGFDYDLAFRPDKKQYELSAATLRRRGRPLPFIGFKKDFNYVVEIGNLEPNGMFNQEWVSIIEVR